MTEGEKQGPKSQHSGKTVYVKKEPAELIEDNRKTQKRIMNRLGYAQKMLCQIKKLEQRLIKEISICEKEIEENMHMMKSLMKEQKKC